MAVELNGNDAAMREVLETATVIAIVGISNDHYYTSYQVGHYLEEMGYFIYPVNPNIDEVDGHPSYESLDQIPAPIDIVSVFRKSDYLLEVTEQAIAVGAKTVWAQLDVIDDEAVRRALEAGVNVATNLCIRTEHERLKISRRE
jgi:hypothetical protein